MLRKNLSTEHTEDTDHLELDGIFLGSLRLEIFGGNLFKEWPWARNYYGSTEDTEGTDG